MAKSLFGAKLRAREKACSQEAVEDTKLPYWAMAFHLLLMVLAVQGQPCYLSSWAGEGGGALAWVWTQLDGSGSVRQQDPCSETRPKCHHATARGPQGGNIVGGDSLAFVKWKRRKQERYSSSHSSDVNILLILSLGRGCAVSSAYISLETE